MKLLPRILSLLCAMSWQTSTTNCMNQRNLAAENRLLRASVAQLEALAAAQAATMQQEEQVHTLHIGLLHTNLWLQQIIHRQHYQLFNIQNQMLDNTEQFRLHEIEEHKKQIESFEAERSSIIERCSNWKSQEQSILLPHVNAAKEEAERYKNFLRKLKRELRQRKQFGEPSNQPRQSLP